MRFVDDDDDDGDDVAADYDDHYVDDGNAEWPPYGVFLSVKAWNETTL